MEDYCRFGSNLKVKEVQTQTFLGGDGSSGVLELGNPGEPCNPALLLQENSTRCLPLP